MSWSDVRRQGSARKSAGAQDEAVSDVVGSILMVGITVGMTVVLALLLMTYDGPSAVSEANLALAVRPGAGGWGTGDETIVVRHLGGDAVSSSAHILVSIGTTHADLTGPALGPAFADSRLVIGETWTRTATIRATDLVAVNIVASETGTSHLLATFTTLPGGSP